MSFTPLGLIEPLLRAVAASGYTTPTPIQDRAIPIVLTGRDLCGVAQTGTGKTAAFALPLLQRLDAAHGAAARANPRAVRPICVLVLAPTRELAAQIRETFVTVGQGLPYRSAVLFGGVKPGSQIAALQGGVDVLVATPGRLLDLAGQGHLRFDALEALVLDEADRMLDMGFLPDVRRVLKMLPVRRQTLLFSATMPADIQALAQQVLKDPARVEVTPVATTAERVVQSVHHVAKGDKRALLCTLLADPEVSRAIVFTRTKHGANRVAELLTRAGVPAEPIHGNKSQSARERALGNFRSGATRVLVATDIAARGIDVQGVSHVFNFELPEEPETYVHRIGRTARAGAEGIAVSLCEPEERPLLRDIERLTRQSVPVAAPVQIAARAAAAAAAPVAERPPLPPRGGRGGPGRGPRPAGRGPVAAASPRPPERRDAARSGAAGSPPPRPPPAGGEGAAGGRGGRR